MAESHKGLFIFDIESFVRLDDGAFDFGMMDWFEPWPCCAPWVLPSIPLD